MSDDPSRRTDSSDASADDEPVDDDAESGDDEPGGGPQRVVSEESVDDILDSLGETRSTKTATPSTADPSPDAQSPTEGDDPSGDDPAVETDPTDGVTTSFDEEELPTPGEDSSDDPSLEALAARVEDGTVTGADVRAAEAGEGRESTPEVDEIELSVDDLEATAGGTDVSPSERGSSTDSSDDGPLAGSVRDETADSSDDGGDEPRGLLGRLTRLFGG